MLISISTVLAICLCAATVSAEPRIGVQKMTTHGEDDLRQLTLSVWYPARAGGTPEIFGGNAVFVGQPAYRDAEMAPGKYPLILLSHGGLRSAADSGAWLSSRLAREGNIVVEVNGPRPDSAADAVNEIWRRPRDVSHALDRILQAPVFSAVVDPDRIAVAGYALGGTAALALIGGRFDAEAFVAACAADAGGPDCAWYAAQGVSLVAVDQEMLEHGHRDPRISTAVAIDTEYADVFVAPSLRGQGSDILAIWLGAPDNARFDTTGLPQEVIETAMKCQQTVLAPS